MFFQVKNEVCHFCVTSVKQNFNSDKKWLVISPINKAMIHIQTWICVYFNKQRITHFGFKASESSLVQNSPTMQQIHSSYWINTKCGITIHIQRLQSFEHLISFCRESRLGRETDGAALQTDLQTVWRLATVLQYPTIQQGRAGVLSAARQTAGGRFPTAAESVTLQTASQTLSHGRTARQHLAEQTG